MVDLQKKEDTYSFAYFDQIKKELKTYPHFEILQRKYIEVGQKLSITNQEFETYKAQVQYLQSPPPPLFNIPLVQEPELSDTDKEELLNDFLELKLLPVTPTEVFTKF